MLNALRASLEIVTSDKTVTACRESILKPLQDSKPASADLHLTAQQLCDAHGISRRMFFNALTVKRNGCDELNALVKSGDVVMNLALEVAQFDHAGQRLILAEFPSIKPRDRAGFVRRVKLINEQEQANGERS